MTKSGFWRSLESEGWGDGWFEAFDIIFPALF